MQSSSFHLRFMYKCVFFILNFLVSDLGINKYLKRVKDGEAGGAGLSGACVNGRKGSHSTEIFCSRPDQVQSGSKVKPSHFSVF